MIDTVPTSG